jgi:hypothetical protein
LRIVIVQGALNALGSFLISPLVIRERYLNPILPARLGHGKLLE